MLIKGEALRFVEVKASSDVIRRNQLTRIKQLRAVGIQTDIARTDWFIDPNQIYVVVDVETTGGRSGLHRMTEIGAVKIQNGQVIDAERLIPPFITKLTGITKEMVANAPLFTDVADSDAIFAAHNVNFMLALIKGSGTSKNAPAQQCENIIQVIAHIVVGYINASLGHHLFDITQAQIKPKIQPDNSVNHIRMETAEVVN